MAFEKKTFSTDTISKIPRSVSADYPIPSYAYRRKFLPKNYKCPVNYCKYFQGKHGIINYEVHGNLKNSIVLCFHGMNASIKTFDKLGHILQSVNYCVVAFDLYGHGLSELPRNNNLHQCLPVINKLKKKSKYHSTDFYVEQAQELIEHLSLSERRLSVVGFSMGGVLAARFVELNIDRVDHLVLISTAGLIENKTKKYQVSALRAFQFFIPCIPLCFRPSLYRRKSVVSNLEQQGINKPNADNIYNYQFWQLFVKKGTLQATFGSIVGVSMFDSTKLFKKIGDTGLLTLMISGAKDKVIPIENSRKLATFFKNGHLIEFPNGCHLIVMNHSHVYKLAATLSVLFQLTTTDDYNWRSLLPFDNEGKRVSLEKRLPIAKKYDIDLNAAEGLLNSHKYY